MVLLVQLCAVEVSRVIRSYVAAHRSRRWQDGRECLAPWRHQGRLMTLFQCGAEVCDVTVPFGPHAPAWPTRPLTVGAGPPARVHLGRQS
jgi:hypothetical protein